MAIGDDRNKLAAASSALDERLMLAGTTNLKVKYKFPAGFDRAQKQGLRAITEEARAFVDSKVGGTKVLNLTVDFSENLDNLSLSQKDIATSNLIQIDKSLARQDLDGILVNTGDRDVRFKQVTGNVIRENLVFAFAREVTGLETGSRAPNTVLANYDTAYVFNQAQQDAIDAQPGLFYTDQDA